jgi:predicted phage-related endonuclease
MQNKLIIHKEILQGSDEWFDVRKLKLTASHAQAIGNFGKGLETYITEMIAYHYSSAEREYYSGKDTDRGNELEPIARAIYELQTGNKVEQVGFIELNEFVGCSPDGLIGEDGGLEIKSPYDVIYYKLLRDGETEIESKYLWQVQMNLLITGRKWWDLVFYNPNYKETIKIFRILPDIKKQESIKVGLEEGIKLIKQQLNDNS